ncbi:MAG: GIY-YIG nuclease family protein [Patescibacteria group bacterium]|nr:GIY-YIG nuclease family protein [Patescibacteria group bacterium]
MSYVYVLQSLKNHRLYTGSTNNLARRINEHLRGQGDYTRQTGPYKLVYCEKCNSLLEARRLERYYKTGKGREKIKDIITNSERE